MFKLSFFRISRNAGLYRIQHALLSVIILTIEFNLVLVQILVNKTVTLTNSKTKLVDFTEMCVQ